VPAFATHLDAKLEVRGLGTVTVDVAYGGMFYVIADAEPLGLALRADEAREIVRGAEMIKAATRSSCRWRTGERRIAGVSIAQLSGPPMRPDAHRRNAVVVSTGKLDWERPQSWTGALDRSPCGTGTCAKMAALHAKGQLRLNDDFVHEGILERSSRGRLVEETQVGPIAPWCRRSGTGVDHGFAQYVWIPTTVSGAYGGDIWGGV